MTQDSSHTDERPADERPVAPTTTVQQDITTAGQRRINLIWETTQAIIACTVVIAYVIMAIRKIEVPTTLNNLLFVIITFYFARTNHTRVGGVGGTVSQDYSR
jgi:hypothetical protein